MTIENMKYWEHYYTAAAVAASEQTTAPALKEISTTEIHNVPIHLPDREHAERTLKQDDNLSMAFLSPTDLFVDLKAGR